MYQNSSTYVQQSANCNSAQFLLIYPPLSESVCPWRWFALQFQEGLGSWHYRHRISSLSLIRINQTYPTKVRSFSLFSSAWLRSCCSSFRTVGMGYWNASSQDLKANGSGTSPAISRGLFYISTTAVLYGRARKFHEGLVALWPHSLLSGLDLTL